MEPRRRGRLLVFAPAATCRCDPYILQVPPAADGGLDCLRSRAHYLETEVIPVDAGSLHEGSLLHADAAPRVVVLQPSKLVVLFSPHHLSRHYSVFVVNICVCRFGAQKNLSCNPQHLLRAAMVCSTTASRRCTPCSRARKRAWTCK